MSALNCQDVVVKFAGHRANAYKLNTVREQDRHQFSDLLGGKILGVKM
jgi:hypothetical protein